MANVLMAIEPYWYEGTWVFNDVSMGFEQEPIEGRFEGEMGEMMDIAGITGTGLSEMIDYMVKDIPNARSGFILLFSSEPFAGYQVELARFLREWNGWYYKAKNYHAQPWLPPTLLNYFDTAPELIYVKAEPWRGMYNPIEVAALKDRIEKLEQLVGNLTLENEALKKSKESQPPSP